MPEEILCDRMKTVWLATDDGNGCSPSTSIRLIVSQAIIPVLLINIRAILVSHLPVHWSTMRAFTSNLLFDKPLTSGDDDASKAPFENAVC